MDLEKLLDHNFNLSKKTLGFCQEAIDISENSLDKLHDQFHLKRILENTIDFVNINSTLKIDYDILFVSICWHDAWKNNYTSNTLLKLLCNYFLDGIGSAVIFIPCALKNKMPLKVIIGSFYAILFHPRFNFLPLISTEAKILRDLDVLDEFSKDRIIELEKILQTKKKSLYFYLLKKYFELFLKKENKFYFESNKNLYLLKKEDYINTVSSLINKSKVSFPDNYQ